MAIKIIVNISKKVPGPQQYSSVQASCSIEAECRSADPVAEAAGLYRQAEAAVDQQLGIGQAQSPAERPSPSYGPDHARQPHGPREGHAAPRRARRGPPPASESQLRLLHRLLADEEGRIPAILHHYQVTELRQLTVAQASELIDQLKQGTPG